MALILILEDDEVIRGQLARMLKDKGHNVEEAADVKEFDSKPHDNISLFLLDVYLPDGDGFSVCEKLRKNGNMAPVIFLTSCDDEESITKGLDIGGDDYITKPFHNAELLSRISSNLRRSARFQENLYSVGDIKVLFDKYKVLKNGVEIGITPTEFNIIKILIQNKGCVVKREVIYDRIWDMHGNYVEYNTLTVAVSRIKAKLGTYGEKHQAYIETIRNVGYRWIDKI